MSGLGENIEKECIIEEGVLKSYTGKAVHIKIPQGVKRIGMGAFPGSSIETVEFCDDVVEVSANAFYKCRNLREIRFSANLEKIHGCFCYCDNLERIYVSSKSLGKAVFSFGRIDSDTDELRCDSPKLNGIYVDGKVLGANDDRLRFFETTPIGYWYYLQRKKAEQEMQRQEQIAMWKEKLLCAYCGSRFEQWSDRCSRCHKEKNY